LKWLAQNITAEKMGAVFPNAPAVLYGEGYGCLSYGTPITLGDGTKKPIGLLVNSGEPIEVLTWNQQTGAVEPKRVLGFKRNSSCSDWLHITYKRRMRGGRETGLLVTPSHEILSERDGLFSFVPASDLSVGDSVYLRGDGINYAQRQMLRGSVLGDGCITDYSYICSHTEDQSDYFTFKCEVLGGLISRTDELMSGYGSHMARLASVSSPTLREILDETYENGEKTITERYLDSLHAPALAVWYMDDGTLRKFSQGHQSNCELCTDAFSISAVENAIKWFTRHGFPCYLQMCKYTFPRIQFTPEGTLAFHSVIAPFVIPSMKHKLLEHLRETPSAWGQLCSDPTHASLVKTVIADIRAVGEELPNWKKVRYDLEVEDNHNFFANNVLVHNSGIQKGGCYSPTKKMILFDVFVVDPSNHLGGWWLARENVEDIASRLGLPVVPFWGVSTIEEATEVVRKGFTSRLPFLEGLPQCPAEGLVGRTAEALFDKRGHRLMVKLKTRDFAPNT
jgi:recombination protein RecA